MEWNDFAPKDPIEYLDPGLESMYQCVRPSINKIPRCSIGPNLSSGSTEEQIRQYCLDDLNNNVQECCPESLMKKSTKPPVYIVKRGDGLMYSCYHDLTRDIKTRMSVITQDPQYNYKDMSVPYQERIKRYYELLVRLLLISSG
jgi:hypothetical protein